MSGLFVVLRPSILTGLCALVAAVMGCATSGPEGSAGRGGVGGEAGSAGSGGVGGSVNTLDIGLFADDVSLVDFDPEETEYGVTVGFLATVLTVRIAPSDSARVSWEGLVMPLDESGALRIELAAGNTGALVVEADDRTYTFMIRRDALDAFTQRQFIEVAMLSGVDFSHSMDVSGGTLVVGAPETDSGGRAFVFVEEGGGWSLQATLFGRETDTGDGFGRSVGVSGETIVVGAYKEEGGATRINGDETNNDLREAGAAYVFVRQGASWQQQAYLKPSNTGQGDWFGDAVAIEGNTVVVGAPNEDGNGTGVDPEETDTILRSGAVYVFTREDTTWRQEALLKASNTGELDRFGDAVAISGDTIVVGADAEDSSAPGVNPIQDNDIATNSGAVYVFARNGGSWEPQAYIKASNPGNGDTFGESVAVSGDTIVVGSPREDGSGTRVNPNANDNLEEAGAAYVFARNGSQWVQQAYLKSVNGSVLSPPGDLFGRGVAIFGDTIVVGAPDEDSAATGIGGDSADNSRTDRGAAYLYTRSGATWSFVAYIKADRATGDFGETVAMSGDTLVIGTPRGDEAYVFR